MAFKKIMTKEEASSESKSWDGMPETGALSEAM